MKQSLAWANQMDLHWLFIDKCCFFPTPGGLTPSWPTWKIKRFGSSNGHHDCCKPNAFTAPLGTEMPPPVLRTILAQIWRRKERDDQVSHQKLVCFYWSVTSSVEKQQICGPKTFHTVQVPLYDTCTHIPHRTFFVVLSFIPGFHAVHPLGQLPSVGDSTELCFPVWENCALTSLYFQVILIWSDVGS